jgi:hypothetical protein
MVVEFSANAGTNAGSFYLLSGTDAGYSYGAISRGNAVTAANQLAGLIVAAPDTAVLSSKHDISGDLSTIRRNGVAGTSGTGDKGTGTFGNYPLYVGRRGGTSVPFNGHLYSLIIRGAQSSDSQIASAESYVNSKTGAY